MRDMTYSELQSITADEVEVLPMDEDEFRSFYERTARVVWAYLSRLTGDRQLADDLLQETFYRFCRARVAFQSEAHRRNLLFRIATNVANDAFRRSGRGKSVSLAELENDRDMPRIDGVAERAQGRTDLARAVAQLKPAQREMLWLAYAHGSSHAEIAEALGLKASSIRLLLFRARRKLAGLLRGGSRD